MVQILWTFSIYLEAVAIFPQLILLQQTQNIDNLTGNYVAFLGWGPQHQNLASIASLSSALMDAMNIMSLHNGQANLSLRRRWQSLASSVLKFSVWGSIEASILSLGLFSCWALLYFHCVESGLKLAYFYDEKLLKFSSTKKAISGNVKWLFVYLEEEAISTLKAGVLQDISSPVYFELDLEVFPRAWLQAMDRWELLPEIS